MSVYVPSPQNAPDTKQLFDATRKEHRDELNGKTAGGPALAVAFHAASDGVDVAEASDQIDALIEKRAAGRDEANATEMLWKAGVRRHNAKLRRERRAE